MMRLSRARCTPMLVALVCLSCGAGAPAPRAAVPIKSACTAGTRTPASVGLDVHQGRRNSEARTIFVTNAGDRPRRVQVMQVSRVEGACSGEWARQTTLSFVDAATGAPPGEAALAPGGRLEIAIGPQRVRGTWDCTKLGLAVSMRVDDETVCADAGAWIAEGDEADAP